MLKLPQYYLGMIFLFILSSSYATAQHDHEKHLPYEDASTELSDYFSAYDIYQEDLYDEYAFLSGNDNIQISLNYGSQEYQLYLYKNNLLSDGYVSRSATGNKNDNRAITLSGFTGFGDVASISIADDFIFGFFVAKDGGKIYIEPARFYEDDKSEHEFVLFHEKEILDNTPGLCGTSERHDIQNRLNRHGGEEEGTSGLIVGACLEVELAIASDFSMFQEYGSIQAVENRNIGVINDVQTNFNSDFNDTLQFKIVEQFVSDCSQCDPWTSSTNASTLLGDFSSWGPSGFTSTHDMGELWTDRNLDGSTVGIAWLGAVCSSNRYHVLQDFTSNANILRVLTAHEMGHNFSASHDASGSPTIMAPSVNNTNQWSNQSKNEINFFVSTIDPPVGCLSNCPVVASPVTSDFGYVQDLICAGTSVQFFEKVIGQASSYSWSFPGGIPSNSTEANPMVSYPGPGNYTVSLTVTNSAGSSDTKTINGAISVGFGGETVFAFEDFEGGGTGQWSVSGNQSWDITSESGVQYGNNTFSVNNFSSSGQVTLESPEINLVGYDNPTLKLNYAYATRNGNSDSLVAYISTDNGATFQRVWGIVENGSSNYATAPNTSSSFSPQDQSDWCHSASNSCLSIPLTGAEHKPNVIVRLRNKSFGGNNLFIDHLYISSDCYNLNPPIAEFSADFTQGCNNLTVNFQDESLENPSNWVWNFPGGTPASSTEQNPVVYYDQPGLYTVTLSVSNPEGSDSKTKVDYIFVEGDPNAFYTYTVNGREVSFQNESADAIDYIWDFGDGNTSTSENPVHTFNQDGVFTVSLTASNSCNSDTHSEDVVITTLPEANFVASDSAGCEPLEIIFDANSSMNTTAYSWEFPGGNPSTGSSVVETVTYDFAGVYDVLFIASNANGNDTILLEDYITVNPLPEVSFLYTEIDLMVEFFGDGEDYNTVKWDFGDGNSSTELNPVHTYSSEGTYEVEIVGTNDCGSDTFSQTIMVEESVNASFTSNITMGCAPLNVEYNSTSSTGVTSFAWFFEGGQPSSSSQENPVVLYDEPGSFDVTLIVSDGLDSDTVELKDYITVLGGPEGDFTYSVNGRSVSFNSSASNFDDLSWNFGDGNTSDLEDPVHVYGSDGEYTASLMLFNSCDTVTIENEVTIATPPTAEFDANITSGCEPLTVSFTNNSSENANSYEWFFEGGTPTNSTSSNPSITYNTEGTYDVQLIAYSDGGSDTLLMSDLITVLPDPEADFDFSVDTLTVSFMNQSEYGDSYFWDFGDGNTSTDENPIHTYDAESSYTVTLSAYNDCDTNTFVREIGTASLPKANFTIQGSTAGCAPYTVQYMNNSTGTVDNYLWEFEGGTPNTSNEENPLVTYDQAGEYDVTLTVSNTVGDNELVREDYIEINTIPTINVNAEVLDSLTVNFEGVVMGDATNTNWVFGDGNSSSQEQVTYTYANAGTYEALFIVSNECGSDTSSVEISVGSTSVSQDIFDEIRIYPNPAQSVFTIDRLPVDAMIQIHDPMQRMVYHKKALSRSIRVNAAAWSSGVYFVNIIHKGQNKVRKLIIQQ